MKATALSFCFLLFSLPAFGQKALTVTVGSQHYATDETKNEANPGFVVTNKLWRRFVFKWGGVQKQRKQVLCAFGGWAELRAWKVRSRLRRRSYRKRLRDANNSFADRNSGVLSSTLFVARPEDMQRHLHRTSWIGGVRRYNSLLAKHAQRPRSSIRAFERRQHLSLRHGTHNFEGRVCDSLVQGRTRFNEHARLCATLFLVVGQQLPLVNHKPFLT